MRDTIDQWAKTAPRLAQLAPRLTQATSGAVQLAPRLAQLAASRVDIVREALARNPVVNWVHATLRATTETEFYLSLSAKEQAEYLRRLFDFAERLYGG
jgi:hypothetical protein